MRSALAHFREIDRILRAARPLVLLDFDGTLAPIAPSPQEARMSAFTKHALRSIVRLADVVIISGRSVSDVRKKVGLRGVTYVGNHGLEWSLPGGGVPVSSQSRKKLNSLYRILMQRRRAYRGLYLEKKRFTFAAHYRLIEPAARKKLAREIIAATKKIDDDCDLRVFQGKRVWEIRPSIRWTKGEMALAILRRHKRPRSATLYVGDDTTDEDAFRALRGAITVRVGKSKRSAARYFLVRRSDVDTLLVRIATSLRA